MTDKLEALSQPIMSTDRIQERLDDAATDNPRQLLAILNDAIAAMEEKDQRIAELNVKLFDQSILLDAAISRAEASGRREEHLKATVDVLSAKNAELQQRLQQPIKLPERYSVDCGVVCDPSGDWLSLDEMVKVLGDAGLEVRSPCPRCNRLLDLTSRPDGAHYCHHKVEGK
ncbi:hypothetical protein HZI30_05430 [Serratia fonticola]|uniref:hypothetical protein n=1 Tax=Serratia fonticola TaxID=47917 RepID=UPI0015C5CAC5|nr:hypothetical protein [Serratia fonticola]NXZ86377.1 hypothetical protein [Serratia fonticola]